MAWIILILSGLFETVWAVALSQSGGLRKLLPTVIFLVGLVASMGGLAIALRTLPVGTAYAVWTGIGAVGAAVWGMVMLGEDVSLARIVCLVLIVCGIVGLKLVEA